ncbi:MAG TPA: nuclear transport factor 2 family protein [Alphaproteobacteria bacterium]|nr:nuclear transport factor 2 family protein [Alphaproteobacteria bacterium]
MDRASSDRLAVRELIELYSDAVTRRDWSTAGAAFAEGAVWTIGGPTNVALRGRAAITKGIADMVEAFEVFVQMTHSIVVELDGDRATARTIVNGFGRLRDRSAGTFTLGTYHDALIRSGKGWLFLSRRFEPIFIDTAAPPGTAFGPRSAV